MQSNAAAIIRWEAQRLAAAGDRQAALELLDRLDGPPAEETAVLRGKILGQQGRFGPAAENFRKALEASPANEEARRGLALAERLGRGPFPAVRLRSRALLAAAVALAVLAVLGWRAGQAWVATRELTAAVASLDRELKDSGAGLRKSADALDERIAGLEGGLRAQREATEKGNDQVRAHLRRMQAQIKGLAQQPRK